MGCVPTAKFGAFSVAWPEPFRLMMPKFETPSRKFNCGGLNGVPLRELTVPVIPTVCPKTEGFALELTVQFVPAGQPVWNVRLQPPANLPASKLLAPNCC